MLLLVAIYRDGGGNNDGGEGKSSHAALFLVSPSVGQFVCNFFVFRLMALVYGLVRPIFRSVSKALVNMRRNLTFPFKNIVKETQK